jgi:hypothetical protein
MRPGTIRLARVPRRLAGAPRLRPWLERWLADCEPARHGLPPEAIVVVRRLQARWAEVVHADAAQRYARLAAVLAGAGRPALGTGSAEAVWFADEAELLACLARDAAAGALAACWWWPLLLRDCAPGTARAAWLRAPQCVPRALQRLGSALAGRWLASWPGPVREALLAGLVRTFIVAPAVRAHVLQHGLHGPEAARTGSIAYPPAQGLQRLCDTLLTDPRSAAGGECLERWAREDAAAPSIAPVQEGGATSSVAPAQGDQVAGVPAGVPRPGLDQEARPGPLRHGAPSPGGEAASRGPQSSMSFMSFMSSRPPAGTVVPDRTAAPAAPAPQDVPLAAIDGSRPDAQEQRSRPEAAPPGRRLRPGAQIQYAGPNQQAGPDLQAEPLPLPLACLPEPALELDTASGGVFFLLNAALQLGLYGDFTQPLYRGLDASPWRFLRLAASALGAPVPATDGLADWLARRGADDNRRRAPWHCPPSWLEPFADAPGAWHAILDQGLLRLRHPAGFDLLREAAGASCNARIAAELERLGVAPGQLRCSGVQVARPSAPRRAPRDPWALMWPLLRARLALALDLPPRPQRLLADTLLRLPARLHDAGERVELHFSLDALPLAVRLSGLDRDPGWIPAAACDVRFYFHGRTA